MAKNQEESAVAVKPAPVIGTIRNQGEPLRFTNVESLAGFMAESAKGGQIAKVWTQLAITSDTPLFHRLAENLVSFINHMAQQAGTAVNLQRANTVLLIFKKDSTAELWLDAAAVTIRCAVKRAVAAGSAIFESDIADVTGMDFPCVAFDQTDKVLCIFREAWRFGFAFDMNPEGKFDRDAFVTALGTLHRKLRYHHLYEAIDSPAVFDRLVTEGWFPFAEIITAEFRDLLHHVEAGFDLAEIEDKIIANFDGTRLQCLLERWISKPHFAVKEALLKEAIEAFSQKKPVTVIKILLTEIEGILNDAYRAAHGGQVGKLKELFAFAEGAAEQRAGGANTLFFPAAFGRYLNANTFANFDPVMQTGTAGSRHAVGHGAAAQESYTMKRALQAILTIDQLAFYT